MKPVLVLYASTEGWTGRVAERIAARLGEAGLVPEIAYASALEGELHLDRFGAVVVAGSIHFGKHQRELVTFVKANAAALGRLPGALVTVSLSEATIHRPASSPTAKQKAAAEIERSQRAFLAETGWSPRRTASVAGALLYTKYGFWIRLAMRFIAGLSGASRDTTRDHVYTDWDALDAWARAFAGTLGAATSPYGRAAAAMAAHGAP